ncbi:MAG TPA: glycosyltransferase [Solirubrobacterales bacterium]|nr:glycosyltransferase [Solirubrobacterales bacterium]
MRLGIVTGSLGGGGAERQAAIWTRLCAEQGHDVTAITIWDTNPAVELPDVRIVHMPKARVTDLATIAWRLRKLESELDAIVAFEPFLGFCCALARLRIPWMIVTGKVPAHLQADSRMPMGVYRWAFDRATLASAPNQGMIDSYREFGFRSAKPWMLIPNIAESDAFIESSPQREGILFVGRLVPVKNPMLAVESAAAVPAPLTLLGAGVLQPEIERAIGAGNYDIPARIQPFTGEPWKVYSRHRVLVVTSLYESFGNVIIESLAAGTPVVSVDCDLGPREIIGDASYSHLTESSPDSLATALSRVLDRPYSQAEETECRTIAERYRPEAVTPLILEAVDRLQELANRSPRSARATKQSA